MFKIDLLKGKGIKTKTSAGGITITVITVAVPVVIALVMAGCLIHSKITASIKQSKIANYQVRIDSSAQVLAFRRSLEKETNIISNRLSEVSTFIGNHIQWSPIIETVVRNIPNSMALTKLEAEQKMVKVKKAATGNSKQANIAASTAFVRTLNVSISGSGAANYDKEVQEFKNNLLSSPLMSPKLDQIRVSRKSQEVEKKETACYEIECTFKPSI